MGLALKVINGVGWGQTCFVQQFKPVRGLVDLFKYNAEFGDDVGSGPATAGSPVVGTDRRCGPEQLRAEDLC